MKRWLYTLIFLVILGSLIGWRLNKQKAEVATQTQQRDMRMKSPPLVSVVPVQVRDVVQTFDAVGTVESPFNVKIAAKVSGNILFLGVHEGDAVTKGQVLVRIDPSDAASAMRLANATLVTAQARLAEAKETQKPTNVAISTQIRQQKAGVTTAQADLDQVRENYAAQQAAAQAAVTEAQGRIQSADAEINKSQAAIRSAQASLDNARSKYNRIHDLYTQGFIAAQDVDDAKTAVSVQQAALEGAQGQLKATEAARDSAVAQKDASQKQASIVTTKGKADIEVAKSKLAQAEAALEYAIANNAQRPAFRQNIAALESGVVMGRGAIVSAKSRMDDTVLKSPLDGYVTMRSMDLGALVTPGVPILTVQSISEVWVTIPIPEEVSRKVAIGQTADVTFDGLPGQKFAGKITQVNPSADPQSRQFSVRITLPNPQKLLKPGMSAHITFTTDRILKALVVPNEAIQPGKKGPEVVVVDEKSVAHHKLVKLGVGDSAGTIVTEGLQVGDKVVILSASSPKEGQTVKVDSKPENKPDSKAENRK